MKKKVMQRAWQLAKQGAKQFGGKAREYFAVSLRMAWAEIKEESEMEEKTLKEQCIERLQVIIENSEAKTSCYELEIVANDWKNYGKNRTYLSIIETRKNSKHYAKYDFGYIDNLKNEYVAGRQNLNDNFNLSGSKF